MSALETVLVGQRGDVPIPVSLLQLSGIEAGSVVTIEPREGGLLIRPAAEEVEQYSAERRAEFLLSNAVDVPDYLAACEEVRRLNLDPEKIPHHRPPGA